MGRIYDNITELIGNTPLLRINRVADGALRPEAIDDGLVAAVMGLRHVGHQPRSGDGRCPVRRRLGDFIFGRRLVVAVALLTGLGAWGTARVWFDFGPLVEDGYTILEPEELRIDRDEIDARALTTAEEDGWEAEARALEVDTGLRVVVCPFCQTHLLALNELGLQRTILQRVEPGGELALLLEHLLLHELIHLLHPNHGPEFRRLMARSPLSERAASPLSVSPRKTFSSPVRIEAPASLSRRARNPSFVERSPYSSG